MENPLDTGRALPPEVTLATIQNNLHEISKNWLNNDVQNYVPRILSNFGNVLTKPQLCKLHNMLGNAYFNQEIYPKAHEEFQFTLSQYQADHVLSEEVLYAYAREAELYLRTNDPKMTNTSKECIQLIEKAPKCSEEILVDAYFVAGEVCT